MSIGKNLPADNEFINTWLKKFQQELTGIQVEFDAFFLDKKLEDHFFIEHNKDTLLTLHFTGNKDLPSDITEAITAAFIKSKPEQFV